MLPYYDQHASTYAEATRNVDMAPLHARFLARVPAGGRVLDVGCGSGRDTLAFKQGGYQVTAFDASSALAKLAAAHTGLHVSVANVLELKDAADLGLPPGTLFDGIWACASLLHVPETQQPQAWLRLWNLLAPNGVAYASYKLGEGEWVDALGRPFTDATEQRLTAWLAQLPSVTQVRTWITADQRPGQSQAWLNALVQRES